MTRHVDPDDLMARTHTATARLRDTHGSLGGILADVLYELAAVTLLEVDAPKPRHLRRLGELVGQVEAAVRAPVPDPEPAPTGGEYPALV